MARAVERYTEGEEIQVLYLGEWRPARVVKTNRQGNVLANFMFASRDHQQVFRESQVRRPYEADALSRGRVWRDASGKFEVRAALLAVGETEVTLRKEDLTELKVPIDKLGAEEVRYLRRLQKSLGPKAAQGPVPPPLEDFAASGGFESFSVSFDSDPGNVALTPDPTPTYLRLKQGGVGFPLEDFFDRIGAVLPVGGPDGWLLAALENATPGGNLPTRLLWASLTRQKIEGRQLLPPGEVVADYHPPSHRLLTYGRTDDDQGKKRLALTVWEVLPTDKEVTPVVRWIADKGRASTKNPWARLVDGTTVVQRIDRHEFVGWSVEEKRVRYSVTQASFFAPDPTLSGGRKYLFLPEDKQIRILDAATGQLLTSLPVRDGAAAVAVSEDGTRAAVLGRSTVTVADLTDPSDEGTSYQAEAIGTPFTAKLRWLNADRLFTDRGHSLVLFSLSERLAIWNYQFNLGSIWASGDRRVRDIIDGHLVYVAAVSAGSTRGLAVGAVKLPGPRVDEVVAQLDRDSLMIVKPGTRMKLDVRAGANSPRVTTALASKIQANGWILDPTAGVVMVAEMKRGETQTVQYRSHGFRSGSSTQTVTVTPYISTVRIKVNDKVAWQSGTSTGAPPILRLKEGESIQQEVNRWQTPNIKFFDSVKIPAEILDPAKRNGLGTTEVSNRGLIPQ